MPTGLGQVPPNADSPTGGRGLGRDRLAARDLALAPGVCSLQGSRPGRHPHFSGSVAVLKAGVKEGALAAAWSHVAHAGSGSHGRGGVNSAPVDLAEVRGRWVAALPVLPPGGHLLRWAVWAVARPLLWPGTWCCSGKQGPPETGLQEWGGVRPSWRVLRVAVWARSGEAQGTALGPPK